MALRSQYTVVAYTGFNDWSYGSTPPNQAGAVTYNFHDATYSNSLTFPTNTNGAAGGPNGTYYGPNFEIASVPGHHHHYHIIIRIRSAFRVPWPVLVCLA
jgi:hypothetical protein